MPRFDQAQVLVVGDVMLDRYWHGGTSRISPEAPVPVVKVDQIEDRPGGAANVALNIAALGAKASLVGVTGTDEAADSLSNSLKAAGVIASFQRIAHQPTIVKLRVMSRHQQLLRIDWRIDWREGERFFMQHLIDGDLASNNGGWQWSSSTGTDASPYFRIFNPQSQSERFDPEGRFIKQWVPELAELNKRDIHASRCAIRRTM